MSNYVSNSDSFRIVFGNVEAVVALRKGGRLVVHVLNVDLDRAAARERLTSLVHCHRGEAETFEDFSVDRVAGCNEARVLVESEERIHLA